MDQTIYLKAGNKILTDNKANAYYVTHGTVRVYMVPDRAGKTGRRALLADVNEQHTVPSFYYTDMDYNTWQFMIVAATDAELTLMENAVTNPLKNRFATYCEVENYHKEGYEEGFIDKYKMILAREDAFFIKTNLERSEVIRRTDELIESVFKSDVDAENITDENHDDLYNTVFRLCKMTHIPIESYEKIAGCCNGEMSLKDIARISHFSIREVILSEGWHKKDLGVLFSYTDDGRPIAFVPRGQQGYGYILDGVYHRKITTKLAQEINPKAYMLYRPLPQEPIGWGDVLKYGFHSLNKLDIVSMVILSCLITVINLFIPTLTELVYDKYVPENAPGNVVMAGCVALAFMIGALMFSLVKGMNSMRIGSHLKYDMQNAIFQRVYEFPESFFRQYESADLSMRIMGFGDVAQAFMLLIMSVAISTISAVIYVARMFGYSAVLSLLGIAVVIVMCIINYSVAKVSMKYEEKSTALNSKASSKLYQYISGIDKIRMAGVEERAIYEYLVSITQKRKLDIKRNKYQNVKNMIAVMLDGMIPIVTYIFLYYSSNSLSTGNYVAFLSAFGLATAAMMSVGNNLTSYMTLKPTLDRIEPVLKQVSEVSQDKLSPGKLTGEIDIDHVTFAYGEGEQPVLNDISLHISQGEYVGIVGSSGCGKSTLFKLLLGFENPVSGKIYYDNQSIDSVDIQQLRRQLGVVLQNGQLIAGSIHENITITYAEASADEVNDALEAVNLSRDIAAMPMGLHTLLNESSETISGGQKQRILIARAIINKPPVLLMDEATSALDNVTQAHICEALDKMNCTRIVIAHRLSTIKDCDRIIVLDKGRIAEEGNFEELYAKKGIFYELASRQMA